MNIPHFPLQTINWDSLTAEVFEGEKGTATWQSMQLGEIRIRMVEYSADYLSDHWCHKGHIIYCISGEMIIENEQGKSTLLKSGDTCTMGDNSTPHKTSSTSGCKFLIID